MRAINEKFANLGFPRRVWAVAAVHGDVDRLVALHDHLASRFATRDRLVYLGNYLGVGARGNDAVIEEILAFRSALLTKPGMEPQDIVHLRGPAEESWQRLLRLQFAPVPKQALEKLVAFGVEPYLHAYGFTLADARDIARAGSVAITRWTNQLRMAQRAADGHEALVCSMRRAAVTDSPNGGVDKRLLLVPAGYDSSRSLEDQGDNLWYGETRFHQSVGKAAAMYSRIVRGFDVARNGVNTDGVEVTLDGGCGRGGPLICGCFDVSGRLAEIVSIGGRSAVERMSVADGAAIDLRRDSAIGNFQIPRLSEAMPDVRMAMMA